MANPQDVMSWSDPFGNDNMRKIVDAVHGPNGDIALREVIDTMFAPWVQAARQFAAVGTKAAKRVTAKSPLLAAPYGKPASTDDVLQEALQFACLHLAFIGRDQGTDRIDRTLDDLSKAAVSLENKARFIINARAYDRMQDKNAPRRNDYADSDTPVQRLYKIAGNLIAYSRHQSEEADGISESFGFTLEAMDQYGEHVKRVAVELEQPSAGTSAYQMVADAATAQVEATETLIHMVAATVLMQSGNDVPHKSVTFSPADMDRMHQNYIMSVSVDGMMTTVTIRERADDPMPLPPGEAHLEAKPESLMTQDEPETPFEPQAAARVHDRPLWAVRVGQMLHHATDREHAQNAVNREAKLRPEVVATVENRFCLHHDCPAERCNHEESAK